MKKIKMLSLGLLLVGIMFSLTGCSYYNDTYKGETAYAVIPSEVPPKEETLDNNGKRVEGYYSYNYKLNFVKEDGTTQEMEYSVEAEKPKPFTPGAYVTAEISKNRVVEGPNYVEESQIPQAVLDKLK